MEEKEILRDLVIDSLNLSRKLIRESTELKLNKNTVYQRCINDNCMKQYKLFKYVKNIECPTLDDLKFRRYDEFESTSKNNFKIRLVWESLIKKLKLITKSFEIKKNKKDIKNLFFSLFVISRDFYNVEFLNKSMMN